MGHATQQQTVTIARGLFLVRYAAAEDAGRPPMIKLCPEPAANKDIQFLLHPDQEQAVLWRPDSCLVVRASAPGKLSVEVTPVAKDGSAAATVKIEPLSQGAPPSGLVSGNKKLKSLSYDFSTFRVLGHIAGKGDQFVQADDWLAGPAAPSRIEGISLDWANKPPDLEIRYAVKTALPQPGSGRTVPLGAFAGTRGRQMPIVELLFEMSGAAASALHFVVEAIFLGAPTKLVTAKRVQVSGPTGREPLVGLRVALQKDTSAQLVAEPLARKSKGRANQVRVFRRREKHNQTEMDSVAKAELWDSAATS